MGHGRDALPEVKEPQHVRRLARIHKMPRAVLWMRKTGLIAMASDDGVVRLYREDESDFGTIRAHATRILSLCEASHGVILTFCGN